uniref:Uncharacterized protein n=1 Tax=Amphora coffeiformis TaxID=265554 RepID=A0A7S3P5P0_9STRA|eukprot:scaffold4060_cov190-Amphora_coffeaeformis.AAC.19
MKKDLRRTTVMVVLLWFWMMNYDSITGTTTAFLLDPTTTTSTTPNARHHRGGGGGGNAINNNHHGSLRRRRRQSRQLVVVQKSAWKDWGIQWDRISHGLSTNHNNQPQEKSRSSPASSSSSPPEDNDRYNDTNNSPKDRTLQGLEKMQTEIGALIEDLQNKHDSNGKEAVLQAKLAALSADLEAYRTAAAKTAQSNNDDNASSSLADKNNDTAPAKSSSPPSSSQGSSSFKKSTTKMSRRMRKKMQNQIGEQVFTKEDDDVNNSPRGTTTHVNGYQSAKPKINGYVDNRYESSSASPMHMVMEASSSSTTNSSRQTTAPPTTRPEKMKVAELRDALQEQGIESKDVRGFRKAELLKMLLRLQKQNAARRSRGDTALRTSSSKGNDDDDNNNNTGGGGNTRSSSPSRNSEDRSTTPRLQKTNAVKSRDTKTDDLTAFVNGARLNDDKKTNGVAAATEDKNRPDPVALNGETKSVENVEPAPEPLDPAVKARQEYFKRRIEEARLRAMSSRVGKMETKANRSNNGAEQQSQANAESTSQSNGFDSDDNQIDMPAINPEVIVDRYDKSSSPYIIEIKDESIENTPRRWSSVDSRRFGEPPKAAPVNNKARKPPPPPPSTWVPPSATVFEPIKPPPEQRRFGMEPPKEPRTTDLPKARIATADTPGDWFGGPSFAKPSRTFDELFQAKERPGMDSPKGPSGSMGPRPARSVAADATPWQRYGEPLYGETRRERYGEPPMPNRNGERKSRFGNPPSQQKYEYPMYEEPESWSKDEGYKEEPQVIQSPLPKPPSNAFRMTRSFVDAVVEAIEEVMESPDEDESKESVTEESTSRLAEAPVSIWDTPFPVRIEGSELRTWSFEDSSIERVQVFLKADSDSPLTANVDLWNGPDDTPHKMTVYLEDGNLHPLSTVMETPIGHNTVAIENSADFGIALKAAVVSSDFGNGSHGFGPLSEKLSKMDQEDKEMESGEVRTWPISAEVSSVQLLLRTYKRPLHARVELVTSHRVTQAIEIYTEDGLERPFYIVMETPGEENVIRVVNTAPDGISMDAVVEPYIVSSHNENSP